MPFGKVVLNPDQTLVLILALIAVGGYAAACKLRDLVAGRGGAGGSRSGRVAVVPDPRRGSPLFDQDADR